MNHIAAPLKPGIPLSSIFLPDGCDKVYSAMSVEEKCDINHRETLYVKSKSIYYAEGSDNLLNKEIIL